MRTTAEERRRAAAYTDFGALTLALKDAVMELRKLTKRDKADVLLCERRVRILTADETSCTADVVGDSASYRVSTYRDGNVLVRECTCDFGKVHPVLGGCSHTKAVDKVWREDIT